MCYKFSFRGNGNLYKIIERCFVDFFLPAGLT